MMQRLEKPVNNKAAASRLELQLTTAKQTARAALGERVAVNWSLGLTLVHLGPAKSAESAV